MPVIEYRPVNFRPAALAIIERANEIARTYAGQGYSLTLRQLYYRFVAAGLIPNRDTEYKRLGSIINDARYAGLFDWSWITDRTRNVAGGDGIDTDPGQTINEAYYSMAFWEGQTERVEVWVEKDALVDVVGRAASAFRAPYFSCRGYTSSSEVWAAAQRLEGYLDTDDVEHVTIIHLGDHDPSGIDMTRDITERLRTFLEGDGYDAWDVLTVKRIALNMPQVQQYNPPPNPAKVTDSRYDGYRRVYGEESWELDALEPSVLDDLIRTNVAPLVDFEKWDVRKELQNEGRKTLVAMREHYDDLVAHMTDEGWIDQVKLDTDPEDA